MAAKWQVPRMPQNDIGSTLVTFQGSISNRIVLYVQTAITTSCTFSLNWPALLWLANKMLCRQEKYEMTLCRKSTWTEHPHTSSRNRRLYRESFSNRPKWESGRRKAAHLIINEPAGNMFYSVNIHGINTSKKLSQRNSSSTCQNLSGSKASFILT